MMYKYKEMNWVTQVVVMEVVALSVLNQLVNIYSLFLSI